MNNRVAKHEISINLREARLNAQLFSDEKVAAKIQKRLDAIQKILDKVKS